MHSKNNTKKHIGIALVILAALGAVVLYSLRARVGDLFFHIQAQPLPTEMTSQEVKDLPSLPISSVSPSASTSPAPRQTQAADQPFQGINLAVPFSAQAPFGDWGLPYQEACEEMSAILVDLYYKGARSITPESANQAILGLVAWEKNRFGYYEHTTAAQTADMLREYFGYKRVDVVYDITVDDIKAQILAGRPVIVPLAGRLTGNRFYKNPGPIYHMLVVKGIAQNGDIITDDVGTRRGYNYTYNPAVFLNAIHDAPSGGSVWGASDDINQGRRAMIIVYPN